MMILIINDNCNDDDDDHHHHIMIIIVVIIIMKTPMTMTVMIFIKPMHIYWPMLSKFNLSYLYVKQFAPYSLLEFLLRGWSEIIWLQNKCSTGGWCILNKNRGHSTTKVFIKSQVDNKKKQGR